MHSTKACFIGIDVGTQGARAVLADERGTILAAHESPFPLSAASREEQSPGAWWEACLTALRQLVQEAKRGSGLPSSEGGLPSSEGGLPSSEGGLHSSGGGPHTGGDEVHTNRLYTIKALSVTSTSGTVIPLDSTHRPLHNALMYSDKRSGEEATLCRGTALEHYPEGFTAFNSSCGLPKMVWFVRNFPQKAARIAHWVHAADYITGRLSNTWGVSDFTNVLKSGFDLEKEVWPSYIYRELPLRREWLPEVVSSGTPIGTLSPALANELGLPPDIRVAAGMTDGCASQVASGAVDLGTWNTTIGTTLVVKGVTREAVNDPEGRFYSHRHPEGYWMPGGASNTGADWVPEFSEKQDLQTLDEQAAGLLPGRHIAYPLRQEGERFPFIAPGARGFGPEDASMEERFLANMEGVACVERYAFELAEALSGEQVNGVYTAGGGSGSDTWLRIRSNVLNKPIYLMKHVSGAVGAAILAASKTHFQSLGEAAHAMTRVHKEIRPVAGLAAAYEKKYQQFRQVMMEKGYIK